MWAIILNTDKQSEHRISGETYAGISNRNINAGQPGESYRP